MFRSRLAQSNRRAGRGIGTIAALVVLVILAALAAAIAVVSSSQHAGAALDLQGARALQAARAGLEYGIYRAIAETPASCGTTHLNLAAIGFTVTVTCTAVASGDAVEQGLGTIYRIRATACQPPAGGVCPGVTTSSGYIERHIEALAERAAQ
ncbi:MAG: agglutinin biogenesis protein MshP [Burkholderiales bacterium]|nr:agglutinin biogenesis protein MshP [Burkholderiales bacterium]